MLHGTATAKCTTMPPPHRIDTMGPHQPCRCLSIVAAAAYLPRLRLRLRLSNRTSAPGPHVEIRCGGRSSSHQYVHASTIFLYTQQPLYCTVVWARVRFTDNKQRSKLSCPSHCGTTHKLSCPSRHNPHPQPQPQPRAQESTRTIDQIEEAPLTIHTQVM
jgi:hypothetical protein